MAEALPVSIDFAFNALDRHRLEADVDPRNLRSIRSLEKLGFEREGLLKERYFVAGEIQDAVLYGLLRTPAGAAELVRPPNRAEGTPAPRWAGPVCRDSLCRSPRSGVGGDLWRMPVLRYTHRLLLGLWLGALVCFAAVVAPALFAALSPAEAGAVVRRVIPRLDQLGVAAGATLIALSLVHDGRPKGRGLVRVLLFAGMATLAATSLLWVTPAMEELRQQAGDKLSELAGEHPIRQKFGRLHGISTALMLLEVVLGLVALAFPLSRRQD